MGAGRGSAPRAGRLIGQTDLETFYGPVKFESSGDHFHDNTGPPPVLVQIKEGEVAAVAPEDVKEADIEYPLKPWNRR